MDQTLVDMEENDVVLYTRMSMKKEEGIDHQRAETTPHLQRLGLRVRNEYCDDGKSATKDNVRRDEFEAIIDLARARRQKHGLGIYTKVGCWHSDRFARRVKELLRIEEAGILIIGKNSGYFDLSTPAGVAMLRSSTRMGWMAPQRVPHLRRDGALVMRGGSRLTPPVTTTDATGEQPRCPSQRRAPGSAPTRSPARSQMCSGPNSRAPRSGRRGSDAPLRSASLGKVLPGSSRAPPDCCPPDHSDPGEADDAADAEGDCARDTAGDPQEGDRPL